MDLKLRNPLAFMDLETTGTNIVHDRIIELSIIKVSPDGSEEIKTMRINPEMDIPQETSVIHGIYNEDVADKPTFKQVAKNLATFLEGCDLAGFNIIKFDVPMLVEEFLRADISFDVSKRKLIDSQKIFHLMEKRNLAYALKFYCGKTLEGAHSAEADTRASLDVLKAQIKKYEDQKVYDNLGKEIGEIKNDMQTLHDITSSNMVDLAGRMVIKDGKPCFNFGKHRGKEVLKVLEKEPNYYDWIMNGEFPLDTKRKLTDIKLSTLRNK